MLFLSNFLCERRNDHVNAMVGMKQLKELGYEEESKEYVDIFRKFRKWYKSQKDFDHIESFFWYGCIRMAKDNDLSLEKLFNLFIEQLQSISDAETDGIKRCAFSVLVAYFFINYPEIVSKSGHIPGQKQESEKEIDVLKGRFFSGKLEQFKNLSDLSEETYDTVQDILEDVFLDDVKVANILDGQHVVPEKFRGSSEPLKIDGGIIARFRQNRKEQKKKKEDQENEKKFEEKLLKLNSKQIDFISEKLQAGYEKSRLFIVMEPELDISKMEAICRLINKKKV